MKNKYKTIKNQLLESTGLSIYALIEAVNSVIKPGEEELVPVVVKHMLETGHARFVR